MQKFEVTPKDYCITSPPPPMPKIVFRGRGCHHHIQDLQIRVRIIYCTINWLFYNIPETIDHICWPSLGHSYYVFFFGLFVNNNMSLRHTCGLINNNNNNNKNMSLWHTCGLVNNNNMSLWDTCGLTNMSLRHTCELINNNMSLQHTCGLINNNNNNNMSLRHTCGFINNNSMSLQHICGLVMNTYDKSNIHLCPHLFIYKHVQV